MKVHEYQARQILSDAGIPVPEALVCDQPADAAKAYEKLTADGATLAVVKAQVHAGGRGKGGGVKLVRSAAEAGEAAKAIMSKPLVTPQTGLDGVVVRKLMVAAGVDIDREYYLSITLDRTRACPVLIASSEGGMDIEKVAEEKPHAIIRQAIHPLLGLQGYEARQVAFDLGFTGGQVRQAVGVMLK
ncbi:MAG: acetate--CoA ligase family protein, partial [Phycisphaerae bacterium]|nr:acetate--CoA ligase family protein [Phycisphaerae bacterium]